MPTPYKTLIFIPRVVFIYVKVQCNPWNDAKSLLPEVTPCVLLKNIKLPAETKKTPRSILIDTNNRFFSGDFQTDDKHPLVSINTHIITNTSQIQ